MTASRRRSVGKIPPEQVAAIVAAYESGQTAKKAGAPFGYGESTTAQLLKRHGVKSRRKYVSDETKQAIVDAYLSGDSQAAAAARFGCCPDVCLKALAARGIISRTTSEACRTYALNESLYADGVTSEPAAYLLGFIATDGNVDIEGSCLSFSLARADRDQLVMVRNILGSDAPINDGTHVTDGKVYEHSAVRFHSRRLVADLNRLGILPAKSHTVQPWDGPPDLMRHYVRGLIDGDGCISLRGKDGRFWVVNFVGNRHMVAGFIRYAAKFARSEKTPKPNARIFQVNYNRLDEIQPLLREIYDGATVFLPRKKAVADQILALEKQGNDWSWLTADHLLSLRNEHGTWKKVAAHLGIDWVSLWNHKKRLGLKIRQSPYRDITAEQLDSLRQELGTWSAVARHLGMNSANIHRFRKRFGQH